MKRIQRRSVYKEEVYTNEKDNNIKKKDGDETRQKETGRLNPIKSTPLKVEKFVKGLKVCTDTEETTASVT